MDQTPQPVNQQPLPAGQPLTTIDTGQPKPPVVEAPSLSEKVDEWLDAHPADSLFEEAPAKGEPIAEKVPPGGETPGAAGETPPGEAQPPSAKPAEAPPAQQQPPAAQPQAEEKPAVAPTPRFDLNAKYVFEEGGKEWSGQQVVHGLRERSQLLAEREQLAARAQEAEDFRGVFDMSAEEAKQVWPPNLTWLRQNPRQVNMMASLMRDPQKAAYILQISDYYDTPEARAQRGEYSTDVSNTTTPYQPVQPQQLPPEFDARVKALEEQNKRLIEAERARTQQHFVERINRELNVAFERYPFLRDNPEMVQALLARAYWINGGDDSANGKGVLDALEMERGLYDAQLSALNTATAVAREAAAPLPPVPPLMGTAGAAPQASAPMRAAHPKQFPSLDDAVEDWYNNPPAQFR